ncbi:MAG: MEDS domain-containing protein [Actinomycetota bacterium]
MAPSRIGESLRAARMRLGWSREALAFHSGVSWSAIAQIESGRRKDVRLSSLSALADALGVSVDHLIGTAAATTPQPFDHRLLTYRSDEDFLGTAIPFFAEGMEQSECLLAVTTEEKSGLLRDTLGDRSEHVEFANRAQWYQSPETALRGYRTFVKEKFEAGAAWVRVVAEAVWSGDADDIAVWTRYESIVNLAFASSPVTFVCTYDEESLPEDVVADALLTHPEFAREGDATANPSYRGPEEFLVHH